MNLTAYCPELNRNVTAAELWNFLYSDMGMKLKLSFQCEDIHCRAHLILRNCYAHMLPDEARFRLYSNERHVFNCSHHVKIKQAINQYRKERQKVYFKRNTGSMSEYSMYSAY